MINISHSVTLADTGVIVIKSAGARVIAKAKCLNGAVVSTEQYKSHGGKIPNVCKELSVKHFSLFDFFRNEGWKF